MLAGCLWVMATGGVATDDETADALEMTNACFSDVVKVPVHVGVFVALIDVEFEAHLDEPFHLTKFVEVGPG